MTPDGYPIYAQSESHLGLRLACHSGVTLAAAHADRPAPVDAGANGNLAPSITGVSRKMLSDHLNPTRAVSVVIDGQTVERGRRRCSPPCYCAPRRSRSQNADRRKPARPMPDGRLFRCLAIVDGVASVQTCLTPVRDGMRVERRTRVP